jgi:transposase
VAAAARTDPGPARSGRRHRLVARVPGRGERPGEKGGDLTGPNPTDRGKNGSKYHLLTDAAGVPLAAVLSAANTHDSMLFEPLLDAAPAVKRRGRGRPRRRPDMLHADKGYDSRRCRAYLRRHGIKARIARRGTDSTAKLGRHRWVVERTVAWMLNYKRLGLRYDRTEQTMTALLTLACAFTCWKTLNRQTEL